MRLRIVILSCVHLIYNNIHCSREAPRGAHAVTSSACSTQSSASMRSSARSRVAGCYGEDTTTLAPFMVISQPTLRPLFGLDSDLAVVKL